MDDSTMIEKLKFRRLNFKRRNMAYSSVLHFSSLDVAFPWFVFLPCRHLLGSSLSTMDVLIIRKVRC